MNDSNNKPPKYISTRLGKYWRGMETKYYIFYCNYQEGDENANVKIYRKDGLELICDNYHASNELIRVWEEKEFTWMSRTTKYSYTLWRKQEEQQTVTFIK